MNLTTKTIAAALCFAFGASAAPAEEERGNSISTAQTGSMGTRDLVDINPLTLVSGVVSFEYEHAVSPSWSFLIGPQVLAFRSASVAAPDNARLRAVGATVSAHYFPGGNALRGLWLGPEMDIDWASATLNDARTTGASAGIAGIVGYTFFATAHVPISIGVGAGYRFVGVVAVDSQGNRAAGLGQGLLLTGRLAVGYSW
jgi:hypothetical protein